MAIFSNDIRRIMFGVEETGMEAVAALQRAAHVPIEDGDEQAAPSRPRDARGLALVLLREKRRRNTRQAYRRDLNQFLGWCAGAPSAEGPLEPLAATRGDLEAYRDWLEDDEIHGYRPATVARKLAVASSYYTRARKEGLIELSPALDLDRPDVSRESARLGLAPGDAARLLEAADSAQPVERGLVWLLLSNGLRISEALAADVSDLRQDGGHPLLRVQRKGHDGGYSAPLNAETAAALSQLAAGRPASDPLFVWRAPGSHNAQRLDRLAALRIIRRLGRQAGVSPELRPHDLRHTFVANALRMGKDIEQVREEAGHRDVSTTQRYARALRGHAEASSQTIVRFYRRGAAQAGSPPPYPR